MLTKEEADKLYAELSSSWLILPLAEVIARYREKPKRKIQLRDIYKNKFGDLLEVVEIMDPSSEYVYPIKAQYLNSPSVLEFNIDGKFNVDDNHDSRDLDLSKPYKIVEVKDVD